MIAAACLLALLAPLAPQEGAVAESDAVLVETDAGLVVRRSEYRDHLERVLGGVRLEELLLDKALEREVAALPAETLPDQVGAVLGDPVSAARRRVADKVARDFDGDARRHLEWRETVGLTAAEELAAERVAAVREARIEAIVRARRVPTERDLRRLFDERYGVDGIAVDVRHRLYDFAGARQRLAAAGKPAGPADVEALARTAASAARDSVSNGAAFDELDPAPIPGYRYQRFGVEFAEAVRAAEVGDVVGPVRSTAGFHLLQVTARRRTPFEDVRTGLLRAAHEAPVSLAEWTRLRAELLEEYGIRRALAARR